MGEGTGVVDSLCFIVAYRMVPNREPTLQRQLDTHQVSLKLKWPGETTNLRS
jgi:hypothetical protein